MRLQGILNTKQSLKKNSRQADRVNIYILIKNARVVLPINKVKCRNLFAKALVLFLQRKKNVCREYYMRAEECVKRGRGGPRKRSSTAPLRRFPCPGNI